MTEPDHHEWEFNLSRTLEHITHWLPTQGPIKDFVHHNTLHSFQHFTFNDAIDSASRLYGAAGYLDPQMYREAYQAGRISHSAVERVIAAQTHDPSESTNLQEKMLSEIPLFPPTPKRIARTGLRARWREKKINLDSLVRPIFLKLLSNYLDQGIAVWRMPHADKKFWDAINQMVKESLLPLVPLSSKNCQNLLSKKPQEAILFCLKRLIGYEPLYERYLLETLLSHPGWSGMVHMVEQIPGSLLEKRHITIEDLIALELTLEFGWITRLLGPSFAPIGVEGETLLPLPMDTLCPRSEPERILELWHEAFEWTYYEDVLAALENRSPAISSSKTVAQVFFCLDDRSESVRRHLEEIDGSVETFGTAGFFGIDFLYQGFEDSYPIQSCPVGVKPRHLVRESQSKKIKRQKLGLSQRITVHSSSNTLFRGWLFTQTLGLWHSIRLALQVFTPSSGPTAEKNLSFVKANTQLHLLRESDNVTDEGYLLGYSFPEMAERVFEVLQTTGLTRNFSHLIVIVGHGSSSTNNPHFAAYDCGACSGKPGAPNARAFAWMANRLEVRALLKEKGITIPETTYFLSGMHDTCRDEIHYFDLDKLPKSHERIFRQFDISFQKALRHNAKERCRRFEMVDQTLSPVKSLKRVRERSTSIFEPRPEYNHATNAVCIVGRRDLTRGLFLDRRAFLNSYDPVQDPDGNILASILEAVVPVCGGINLEYYFSRVDNNVYGAGTKLPHNVVSLVGVANGTEGDLRTGLPSQMIEVHDPIRLLLIIEQTPDITLKAVQKSPKVFEWFKNQWIHLASFHPTERKTYWYQKEEFIPCEWNRKTVPSATDSLSVAKDEMGNLPVHEIRGES